MTAIAQAKSPDVYAKLVARLVSSGVLTEAEASAAQGFKPEPELVFKVVRHLLEEAEIAPATRRELVVALLWWGEKCRSEGFRAGLRSAWSGR